jgi:hypothetical protein
MLAHDKTRRVGTGRRETTQDDTWNRIRAWREQPYDPVAERPWEFESPLSHPPDLRIFLLGYPPQVEEPEDLTVSHIEDTSNSLRSTEPLG